MNELTEIQQPKPSIASSAAMSALALELAKMLKLVAPISMSAEAQMVWLQAAVDALDGIHAHEVSAISAELRRSVTRHSQIVPEISKLVAEKRARTAHSEKPADVKGLAEYRINCEAQVRRGKAQAQDEIEAAWKWERDARIAAALPVAPTEPPLTRREIANLSPAMVKMGLKVGALKERDGQVVNA